MYYIEHYATPVHVLIQPSLQVATLSVTLGSHPSLKSRFQAICRGFCGRKTHEPHLEYYLGVNDISDDRFCSIDHHEAHLANSSGLGTPILITPTMRLVLFILVVAVTLVAGTDAVPTTSTPNNNVKPQAVVTQDIAERLLKRRSDGVDGAWVGAADQEERVNSAAVATLTKSSSAKYKTWWNKALSSIFKHMTPKKYRPSEVKMTTNTGRYHPFRLEGN